MPQPTFSVLIPTCDRPSLVVQAARSVLQQTERDFELVISDNSLSATDAAHAHRALAELCQGTAAYRYIRPPTHMSMPDHWEWASRQTRSEFLLVLTDRFVLRPSALALLKSLIEVPDTPEVLTWNAFTCLSPWGTIGGEVTSGLIERRRSISALQEYLDMKTAASTPIWRNSLPRTICNCFSAHVARRVRERNGRLFCPISPDYTSAFHLLAHSRTYTYIDRPLSLSHGRSSNGARTLLRPGYADRFAKSVGKEDWVSEFCLPFKSLTNMIMYDFVEVARRERDLLGALNFDLGRLIVANLQELDRADEGGAAWNTSEARSALLSHVPRLPKASQDVVHSELARMAEQGCVFKRARRLHAKLQDSRVFLRCSDAIRRFQAKLAGATLYRDAVQAAAETDSLVWEQPTGLLGDSRRSARL